MADAASPEMINQTIVQMLDVLGFKAFLKKKEPTLHLTLKFFDNFDFKKFCLVKYFLFCKLYGSSKTETKFRGLFPARDVQQENGFKKVCIDLLDDIGSKHPESRIGKVLPVVFHRITGEKFMRLLYRFVLYVAQTTFKPHGIDYDEVKNSTLEDCEAHYKEKVEQKEKLSSKMAMYDELLGKERNNILQAIAEADDVKATLDKLPSMDDVQRELDRATEVLAEQEHYLSTLPIMDPSIDFGEKWEYNLPEAGETALVNKIRDNFHILNRFMKDPKRFAKEIKKLGICEKLVTHMDQLNRISAERIEKLKNDQAALETSILSTEKAKEVARDLDKIAIQLDYQPLMGALESVLNDMK